jgi:kinetochore protein NNF1
MRERNVTALLNSLDRLIHDAKQRKAAASSSATSTDNTPIPPHTLPPAALVNAHLAPFLTDMRTSISSEKQALEESNKQLIATIRAQRVEMEGLVRGLEGMVADLEKSARMVQEGEGVEGLGVEVRMVEEELKG